MLCKFPCRISYIQHCEPAVSPHRRTHHQTERKPWDMAKMWHGLFYSLFHCFDRGHHPSKVLVLLVWKSRGCMMSVQFLGRCCSIWSVASLTVVLNLALTCVEEYFLVPEPKDTQWTYYLCKSLSFALQSSYTCECSHRNRANMALRILFCWSLHLEYLNLSVEQVGVETNLTWNGVIKDIYLAFVQQPSIEKTSINSCRIISWW